MVGRNITRENGISATSQLPLTQPVKNGTSTQSKCLETKKITDYNYFLNQISKRRKPCILREIMHAISKMPTNPISFAVGIPNGKTFPFESMDINLKDGSKFTLEGKEMEAALQYLPSVGYLPLIRKMEALQDRIHGAQDWSKQSLMITAGSQEALYNAVEMLISDGDSIIIPSPMFSGTVELLRPHNPRFISVPQDGDGMRPDVLREELQRFEKEGIPLPKVMYTNPTGCNPTGVNLSTSRKKEFYQLACDYNFIILEDDPYYYLHFMKENPQSFLSLDTEGRVLRFDSFSKIMSSGLRLGYVTGPSPLIRNMELHVQISTLHTSALSQVLINRLIDEWGIDRLLESYTQTRDFYREKRDHMIAACEKHLTGLAEWNVPNGGMFLWIRIEGVDDSYKLCVEECVEKNLLIVPGHPFFMNVDNCTYVRLSYSLTNIEEMDKGFACLADVIRQRICNS